MSFSLAGEANVMSGVARGVVSVMSSGKRSGVGRTGAMPSSLEKSMSDVFDGRPQVPAPPSSRASGQRAAPGCLSGRCLGVVPRRGPFLASRENLKGVFLTLFLLVAAR